MDKLFCPNCDELTDQRELIIKSIPKGIKILRKCLKCGKGVLLTLDWSKYPLKSPTIEEAMKTPVDWKIQAVELGILGNEEK